MKKIAVLTGMIVAAVAASVSYSQGVPAGQPFQQLQTLVNAVAAQVTQLSSFVSGLATQVINLETAVAALQSSGGSVTRIVIAGTIDLNGPGDVTLEATGPDNIKRVRHFAKFAVAGLTTDDPPTISLFHRPRTDGLPPFATTTGFIASNLQGTPPNLIGGFASFTDPTAIAVEEGQILLRFRAEIFNPSTSPTPNTVRYGLDGPGGTGDFRLVLIR